MIYAKVHNTESGIIVALCDSALINEILKEGDIVINIKDYADFYKGNLVSQTDAENLLGMKIDSANVVGRESINAALNKGLVDKKNILSIGGVPYANAYKINE
jgi:hypothetical protein